VFDLLWPPIPSLLAKALKQSVCPVLFLIFCNATFGTVLTKCAFLLGKKLLVLFYCFSSSVVGGPVGLSPPPFFILVGNPKFEERTRSKEREEKTDGPRIDNITISASTNKMKLVRFYSPAIRLQLQNI
jgi:hypothetical protein